MVATAWLAFPATAGQYERVTVHGTSLEGNLAGDPADRPVSVYLPPGYATGKSRRYPVLYLLHGFTDSDSKWFAQAGPHFVSVPRAVDAAFAAKVPEMIVVMPNAFTKFEGSMYSNSVVTGNWERFIIRELVAYVDSHYRTLATPQSRGLAGHSMGGYGAVRLALKYPGIFASVYAMSPCCMGSTPPPAEMLQAAARVKSFEEVGAADFLTKAMLASAAAWSPNPRKPPLYVDLPLVDGKLDPGVLAEWTANSPLALLHQYHDSLKTYRAFAVDSGDKDNFIAPTVTQLHALLEEYSVPHGYEIYDGDHLNRIESRLVSKVLPFFGQNLEFAPRRK